MATGLLAQSAGCAATGKRGSIVVIGAGIAGLAAAAQLSRAGFAVKVVEARQRIGGRIHTSRTWADLPIDLGASWIHGIRGNPLTKLAHEAGASTVTTSYDSAQLHIDPQLARIGVGDTGEEASAALLKRAFAWAENQDSDVSIAAALGKIAPPSSLSPARKAQLDFHVATTYEQEYSGSADTMSAWSIDDNVEFDGDDALFPNGYDQITDHLARGLDITTGKTVKTVRRTQKGVKIELTGDGVIEADQVLITVPLGVLKTGAIAFDPPLSVPKQRAITRLGMGLLNKHWLRFDKSFWPTEYDWHEFLSPRKGEWAEWVSLAKLDGTPVLLVFSAADHAERIERLADREIVANAMEAARTMFGSSIPEPLAAQITRWRSDPHALGSYSFNAVGSTNADRKALAQSEGSRLHFAGEATSVDYPGTVHGALLSGRAVARTIISGKMHG